MEEKCPTDQPEAYAPNYIQGEEHAELFEKMKLLHDEAQKKGLISLLIMQSPNKQSPPIRLFHLLDEPVATTIIKSTKDGLKIMHNFNWLMSMVQCFADGFVNNWRAAQARLANQEGEEWKNER